MLRWARQSAAGRRLLHILNNERLAMCDEQSIGKRGDPEPYIQALIPSRCHLCSLQSESSRGYILVYARYRLRLHLGWGESGFGVEISY